MIAATIVGMASKLFRAVVSAGISLGTSAAACSLDAPGAPGDAIASDAGADAFCDAAWPTTKAHPIPTSCIDPNGECADAGGPHFCLRPAGDGGCDLSQAFMPSCASGAWQCRSGTYPLGACP
jgi:hypothetical protein